MAWFIGIVIVALIINTAVVVLRDNRTEAQIVPLRSQLSDLPALRSTVAAALSNTAACVEAIDKLRAKQEASAIETAALRMSMQALVIKLAERRKDVPPPSSSGVRAKGEVHYISDVDATATSCGAEKSSLVAGFGGREGPEGWTSERERVTCAACVAAFDNGETTVMSRRAS